MGTGYGGTPDIDSFVALADSINPDGENDQQISVASAHRTFGDLIGSPKRALKIFTAREHVSLENMPFGAGYIAGWAAKTCRETPTGSYLVRRALAGWLADPHDRA